MMTGFVVANVLKTKHAYPFLILSLSFPSTRVQRHVVTGNHNLYHNMRKCGIKPSSGRKNTAFRKSISNSTTPKIYIISLIPEYISKVMMLQQKQQCPWSTIKNSQSTALTMNWNLPMGSRDEDFTEDQPNPAQHHPELCTWKSVC